MRELVCGQYDSDEACINLNSEPRSKVQCARLEELGIDFRGEGHAYHNTIYLHNHLKILTCFVKHVIGDVTVYLAGTHRRKYRVYLSSKRGQVHSKGLWYSHRQLGYVFRFLEDLDKETHAREHLIELVGKEEISLFELPIHLAEVYRDYNIIHGLKRLPSIRF